MNLLFLTRSNQIPPYCFVRTLQGFFLGHYWHCCYVGYVTFTNWRNSKIGTNFYKTYSLEVQTVLRTRKTCKTRILLPYTRNSKTAIHQRYKRKFFWELLQKFKAKYNFGQERLQGYDLIENAYCDRRLLHTFEKLFYSTPIALIHWIPFHLDI